MLFRSLENAVRHGGGKIYLTVTTKTAATKTAVPEKTAAETGATETAATEGALVEVVIADDGPGIPEEMMDRVFTRFWRGNRRGGTGLGLYIVKGIVEAHGGTITVGRAPSGGASFRFTLPAAADFGLLGE